MLEVIKARRSGREFRRDKTVTPQQIDQLIEAARWAPSCYGDEPWRFIICDAQQHPQAWQKLFAALVEFNQGWAKNAQVLIAVVSKNTFSRNGMPNRWAAYDTGAAAMNMADMATSLGLMTHQMGGFDEETVKSAFGINGDYSVMAVMAVGYEAEHPTDSGARERRPVGELFFHGEFKN